MNPKTTRPPRPRGKAPVAKAWALDAKCATPAGWALIDLLTDHPTTWEHPQIRDRIQTLCNTCPVKTQCRRLGEEHATKSKWQIRPCDAIPYAGHPLKYYLEEKAA